MAMSSVVCGFSVKTDLNDLILIAEEVGVSQPAFLTVQAIYLISSPGGSVLLYVKHPITNGPITVRFILLVINLFLDQS